MKLALAASLLLASGAIASHIPNQRGSGNAWRKHEGLAPRLNPDSINKETGERTYMHSFTHEHPE